MVCVLILSYKVPGPHEICPIGHISLHKWRHYLHNDHGPNHTTSRNPHPAHHLTPKVPQTQCCC